MSCEFICYTSEANAYRAAQKQIDLAPKSKGITYGNNWYRVFACEKCNAWHCGVGRAESRLIVSIDKSRDNRRPLNIREKK